ncbi:hypothetical protein [Vreelandella titanicae]|uniref:hypothetical protein n=1 Tax=Vreelandella titanicae TaxID=664683 RepID=UPI0039BF45ED
MKAANIRKPHVVAFCQRVVPGAKPVYVPFQETRHAQPLNCFFNIRTAQKALGGEMVVGWSIWEWPRVLIEAEFHAVLRLPDGRLIDLTPRNHELRKISFIEDPNARDEGQRVDNIREPLKQDATIEQLIALMQRHFDVANEIEVVDERAKIQLAEEERQLVHEIEMARDHLQLRYG